MNQRDGVSLRHATEEAGRIHSKAEEDKAAVEEISLAVVPFSRRTLLLVTSRSRKFRDWESVEEALGEEECERRAINEVVGARRRQIGKMTMSGEEEDFEGQRHE